MDRSGDHVFAVELLWTLFYKLLPPPTPLPHPRPPARPPTPLATLAQNWCAPSKKNDLKWPQIKQVTNSKPHYIKANRLHADSSSTKDSWPNTSKSWLHQLKILKRGFPQSLPGAN